MFLGENLLPYLVLAMGAALAVGNLLALVAPRESAPQIDDADGAIDAGESETTGDLERPPLGRSLLMIVIGSLAAMWAIASLLN